MQAPLATVEVVVPKTASKAPLRWKRQPPRIVLPRYGRRSEVIDLKKKDIETRNGTLVVGDLHCKQAEMLPRISAVAKEQGARSIVLLGDYTDEWGSTADDVLNALDFQIGWLEEQTADGMNVTCLVGNHDFEYLIGRGCSGTHHEAFIEIRDKLQEIEMQAAACVDGFLLTHAGLTQEWRDENLPGCDDAKACATRINEFFFDGSSHCREKLSMVGWARGGYGVPGPLWADLSELRDDTAQGINQIVGHTPVPTCEKIDDINETIWLCDTLSRTTSNRPIGDGTALLLSNGHAEVVPLRV